MTATPATHTSHRQAHEPHIQAPGYADYKADHLARLHKIEGQIHGISRTVTDDRYCMDVLTQISAAPRALQEVAPGLPRRPRPRLRHRRRPYRPRPRRGQVRGGGRMTTTGREGLQHSHFTRQYLKIAAESDRRGGATTGYSPD